MSLFLKYEQNSKQYYKSVVSLSSELSIARYLHSDIRIITTRTPMKFTIVCGNTSSGQSDVTIQAPSGEIQLNMTCRASNDYLGPYY